jgi:hypothetical protein
MKISIKQTLGLTAASCLALACSAIASPPAGAGPRGNSSFGMSQRTDVRTGSANSSFGRTTAENARMRPDDADDQDVPRTKKVKTAKHTWSSYPGNSAFGRSQRVNHLKGSGNNIHGKTTSANAKLKHASKNNRD